MLGAEFTSMVAATQGFLRGRAICPRRDSSLEKLREGKSTLLIPQRMQDSLRRLQKVSRYFKRSEGIRRGSRSSYLLTGVRREPETLHVWESHLLVKAGDLGHTSLVNIKPLGVNFGIVSLREQLAPPSTKLVLLEPWK